MHSPTMQVRLSHEAVARGKEDTVYVSFDVIASGHAAVSGEPTDIMLVLDTSRSMHGEGIDAVRKAVRYWATNLRPTDTLGVVGFGSWAEVLLPATRVAELTPERIEELCAALKPDGNTALHDGLQTAADNITPKPGRLVRFVLVTDGRPTDDKQALSYKRVAQRVAGIGAVVDCLGVSNEYDERVLNELVDGTGGLWSHAADPMALNDAVAVQVARATQVVGEAQELTWTMADGVALEGVYEYRPAIRELPVQEGSTQSISVPPLSQGEKRTIVAAIRFTASDAGDANSQPLFTVRAPDGTQTSHALPVADTTGKVDATLRGLFEVSRTQVLAVDEETRGEAARKLAEMTDDKELAELEEVRSRIERTRTIVIDDNVTPEEVHRAKTVVMQ